MSLRPSVQDLRDLGPFVQGYRWGIQFILPEKLDGYTSKALNFRAASVSIPEISSEKVEISIRGFSVRQPGKYSSSYSLTITFYETVNMYATRFLNEYKKLCFKGDNSSEFKKDLESTIIVYQLDSMDTAIMRHTFVGCFIESSGSISLDSTSADALQQELTFSFDTHEQTYMGTDDTLNRENEKKTDDRLFLGNYTS